MPEIELLGGHSKRVEKEERKYYDFRIMKMIRGYLACPISCAMKISSSTWLLVLVLVESGGVRGLEPITIGLDT